MHHAQSITTFSSRLAFVWYDKRKDDSRRKEILDTVKGRGYAHHNMQVLVNEQIQMETRRKPENIRSVEVLKRYTHVETQRYAPLTPEMAASSHIKELFSKY